MTTTTCRLQDVTFLLESVPWLLARWLLRDASCNAGQDWTLSGSASHNWDAGRHAASLRYAIAHGLGGCSAAGSGVRRSRMRTYAVAHERAGWAAGPAAQAQSHHGLQAGHRPRDRRRCLRSGVGCEGSTGRRHSRGNTSRMLGRVVCASILLASSSMTLGMPCEPLYRCTPVARCPDSSVTPRGGVCGRSQPRRCQVQCPSSGPGVNQHAVRTLCVGAMLPWAHILGEH